MTKDNARDYLPLVQALAEGKVIQINDHYPNPIAVWVDYKEPIFNLSPDAYRIKPEPRVWWVNEWRRKDYEVVHTFHDTPIEADRASFWHYTKLRTFKVVEVME